MTLIGEFLNLAKEYARSLGKSHMLPSEAPTYGWLRSSLNRKQDLMLKKSEPLEQKRVALT
jgi:hypothetical protein